MKNDKSKKKDKRKSSKDDSDNDEETPYEDLTDEEKDARDYQLQRAMELVIAMGKMQERNLVTPTDIMPDAQSDETESKK